MTRTASQIDQTDDGASGELELGACCLCHCALDFSDRAAFFRRDRHEDYNEESDEEEYFFRPTDPYVPEALYDKHNALVYCDSCDRMYHQKCHFVPLTVLPRGEWSCLYCQSKGAFKHIQRKHPTSVRPTPTEEPFRSPPSASTKGSEETWEHSTRDLKAQTWKSELQQRLKGTINGQLSNCRLAETSLETLTSTAKNRSHFTHTSQEIAQLLCRLYGARWKLRELLENLRDIQRSTGATWQSLHDWIDDENVSNDFVQRVLFPFGREHPRRTEPRTPEMKIEAATPAVPKEILVNGASRRSSTTKADTATRGHTTKKTNDDDSGITLDDLQCYVCHNSEASDENDLILCDGAGCFRAYHMHCVKPHVTLADLGEDDDDWFCPICRSLSDHMLLIQTHYIGDDWEQRRLAADWEDQSKAESLQSWVSLKEVFPTAQRDYEAAMQLKEGKRNTDTDELLARVLGLDEVPASDDDNIDEDGHFDLDAHLEEKKRRQRANDEHNDHDGDSIASSQATLVEMSSVELEIGQDELAALSEASDEESVGDDSEEASLTKHRARRSRRLRRSVARSENTSESDVGKLDEGNIVQGKRGRKKVDYVLLNDAIFGDLSDGERGSIDDADEFVATTESRRDSASNDDEDDDDDDDNDDDQSGSDGGSTRDSRSHSNDSNSGSDSKSDVITKNEKQNTRRTQSLTTLRPRRKRSPPLAATVASARKRQRFGRNGSKRASQTADQSASSRMGGMAVDRTRPRPARTRASIS